MTSDYDDLRFVYARRLLSEPELWRRTGEVAIAIEHLNTITADHAESSGKRMYAEKMKKQLCVAAKPPTSIYASGAATL